MTISIAAEAFKRKDEMGGGYRGVAIIRREDGSKERIETSIHDTQQNAWVAICGQIWAIGKPVLVAHFRSNRFRKDYTI